MAGRWLGKLRRNGLVPTSEGSGTTGLMAVGEIHPVGVLQASDNPGAVLYLEIGLHDLDVVELALVRRTEIGAPFIQREEAVVGLDELVDGG